MPSVVVVTLSDPVAHPGPPEPTAGNRVYEAEQPRVPVLSCAEALTAAGARTELVTARDDGEIDASVKAAIAGQARLVVAAATDAQLRAVVRRMVRILSPPPSQRPTELPEGRTVVDLPPVGVLPLAPAVPELVQALDLPREPASVAAAVLAGRTRRYDLLRTDAGSVTLHGVLLGGVDAQGRPGAWRGRVEVDDAVLTDGDEPVLACSIRNAGAADVEGLPLVEGARPDDGRVEVAVAVPQLRRRLLRTASVRFEVRRAGGRAVSVNPRGAGTQLLDDGVSAPLTRKRAWWTEPGAWATYVT